MGGRPVNACTIEGCDKPVRARGWCATHHQRWRVHGDPNTVIVRTRKQCAVDGCDKPAWSRELCSAHLSRMKRHGSIHLPSDAQRFWSRVDRNGPVPAYRPDLGPCWLWRGAGANHNLGYGIWHPRRSEHHGAHRYAYELVVGVIPEGLHLDHLCRVPSCVNPSHLEPVTPSENTIRGNAAREGIPA